MNIIKFTFGIFLAAAIPIIGMEPPAKPAPSTEIVRLVEDGDTETLAPLLATVNINAPIGSQNLTLLHYAVASRQLEMLRFLLDQGAHINALDRSGLSPLFLAIEHLIDRPEMITIAYELIDRGADVTIRSRIRQSSLLHVLTRQVSERNGMFARQIESLAQFLIKKGVDINARDSDGITALELALRYGNIPVIRALLSAGASITEVITPQRSLQELSTRNPELGRLLLMFGIQPNARPDQLLPIVDFLYPLTAAPTNRLERFAALCDIKALKLWLSQKAKGKNVGNASRALSIAAGRNCIGAVKQLMRAGADVTEALVVVEGILGRSTLLPMQRIAYENIRSVLVTGIIGYLGKTSYFTVLPTDLKKIVLALFAGKKPEGM